MSDGTGARFSIRSRGTLVTALLVGVVITAVYFAVKNTKRTVTCDVQMKLGVTAPALPAHATFFIDFERATMSDKPITLTKEKIAWKHIEKASTEAAVAWTVVSEGTIDRVTGAMSERSTRTSPNENLSVTLVKGQCSGMQ